MGIALSTIGIKVSYAVEATAGTRPTTNIYPTLNQFRQSTLRLTPQTLLLLTTLNMPLMFSCLKILAAH